MKDTPEREQELGDLLQNLVNQIAHRGGQTLRIMNEVPVTLQQLVMLHRLCDPSTRTPSDLAAALGMSLPSVSQMIDRLFQLKLVTRAEMAGDRRKKEIALTPEGRALLARLHKARSAEYEAGLARLSPKVRAELKRLLYCALMELRAAG
jgi:DNA-binding MarR family transcriptional regulator